MSFLVRTKSISAAGREIVRSRMVERNELTIGRDPASDIHLTDLEVTRHHARLRLITARRVEIEARARLPLSVDGRQTHGTQIDAFDGAELLVGRARIRIGLDAETGLVTIDVSRVDQAPTRSAAASLEFSFAAAAPRKRRTAWLLALIILLGFLIWPIAQFNRAPATLTARQMTSSHVHADRSWSPGALSNPHAALERDCKSCHVDAFVAVPDRACKTCHVDVHDHADPAKLLAAHPRPGGIAGLKQSIAVMFGRDPGRCVDCHVEHQGAGAMMPVSQTLCSDCHSGLSRNLPGTKLGDAGDFARAHPQFRPSVMTTPGARPIFTRFSLDAAPVQSSGLKFPHALHLDARGGVTRMATTLNGKPLACASCHVPDDSGARFQPVSMDRNCQQCHSLALGRVGGTVLTVRHGDTGQAIAAIRTFYTAFPGGSAFVQSIRQRPGGIAVTPFRGGGIPVAIRRTFSEGGACYGCHVIKPPATPGGLDFDVVPVRQQLRFMDHGWFDHAAHATSTCATCHAEATTSNDAAKLMLPGIKTCRSCHGGPDARPPLVKSSCVMCHDYHRTDGAPKAMRIRQHEAAEHAIAPLRMDWNRAPAG